MAQNQSDNFQLNAPKQLDNRSGVFRAGVWTPYNDITEFNTINPILGRFATQSFWVKNPGDATKADLYALRSDKTPYKILGDIDLTDVYAAIQDVQDNVNDAQIDINNHIDRTDNPHAVTKSQVGLGNVDNTSDLNKPISTAQQASLDIKADLTYVDDQDTLLQNQIDEKANVDDIQTNIFIDYYDTAGNTYTNSSFANKIAGINYNGPNGPGFSSITFDSNGLADFNDAEPPFTVEVGFQAMISGAEIGLSSYTLLNQTKSLLDGDVSGFLKTVQLPSDKSNEIYSPTSFVDNVYFYGQFNCAVTAGVNTFKNFNTISQRVGTVQIAFVTVTAGVATVVYQVTKNIAIGINTFNAIDLSLSDMSAYPVYYVMAGNVNNTERTLLFKSVLSQTDGFAAPKAGGAIITTLLVSRVDNSFWIDVETSKQWDLKHKVYGVSDLPALIQAINSGAKYIQIAPVTIIVDQTLFLKADQIIEGFGDSTVLQASDSLLIVIDIGVNSSGAQIKNLKIKGVGSAIDIESAAVLPALISAETNIGIGTKYGVYVHGTNTSNTVNRVKIENVWLTGFNADAIFAVNVGYISGNLFPEGIHIHNVFIDNCYRGINLGSSCEYSSVHAIVRYCLIGITVKGGNNHIIDPSMFTANRIGIHYSGLNSGNDGHGKLSASANHCILAGAYFKDIKNGQDVRITVFFGGVTIDNCKGINWVGGQVGNSNVVEVNPAGKNSIIGVKFQPNTSLITASASAILKLNSYAALDGNDTLLNN